MLAQRRVTQRLVNGLLHALPRLVTILRSVKQLRTRLHNATVIGPPARQGGLATLTRKDQYAGAIPELAGSCIQLASHVQELALPRHRLHVLALAARHHLSHLRPARIPAWVAWRVVQRRRVTRIPEG